MHKSRYFLLTVDLEDWFQVENLRIFFPLHAWEKMDLRCNKNVDVLLSLFKEKGIKATFFIQAWIAEKMPSLIKRIYLEGHEIASHGYYHTILSKLNKNQLKDEFIKSKRILEDIIGKKVIGYRAPNFSISESAIKILHNSGYKYDSSYNSFRLNKRYGKLILSKKNCPNKIFNDFYEIPISNLCINGLVLPWGGGAYFRIIPISIFILGVRYILRKEGFYLFYIHPWEIDPNQPIVKNLSFHLKFRHYYNLKKTYKKLSILLDSLKNISFTTCSEYIKNANFDRTR